MVDLKRERIRRADIEEIFLLNLKALEKEIDNRKNSLIELRERDPWSNSIWRSLRNRVRNLLIK